MVIHPIQRASEIKREYHYMFMLKKQVWCRLQEIDKSGSRRSGRPEGELVSNQQAYWWLDHGTRSNTRDRTGTTEIHVGLKFPGWFGGLVLATGRIRATLHCYGIVEEFKDRLNNRAIHLEHTGHNRRRYHAEMLSRPSAVGPNWSRMDKMVASVQNSTLGAAVLFLIGCRYLPTIIG